MANGVRRKEEGLILHAISSNKKALLVDPRNRSGGPDFIG